jgi:FkbM family methyltransferase
MLLRTSFKVVRKVAAKFGISVRRQSSSEGLNAFADMSKIALPAMNETILDVGANCGQTIQEIRRNFSTAPIHAFEPILASYETAKRRVGGFRDVTLVHAAVGAQRSCAVIYSNGTSEVASLRDTSPSLNKVANPVTVIPLDEYCAHSDIQSIYLLKTDTEGFDLQVLEGASKLIQQQRINFILCEVGFSKSDETHTFFPEVVRTLAACDYVFAHMYDIEGFWHLKRFGYTYANALFTRKDLLLGQAP